MKRTKRLLSLRLFLSAVVGSMFLLCVGVSLVAHQHVMGREREAQGQRLRVLEL